MHPWSQVQLPPVIGLCTFFLVVARLAASDSQAGVLVNTLFRFENQVCQGEKLQLRCPYGTTIIILWAKYGRQVPSYQMCGSFTDMWDGAPIQNLAHSLPTEDTNCLATTSLQIVLNKCQDRRVCKVEASAEEFGQDPCPGTSKYLEVAYKCRPNEFRSRITCEGDELLLHCKKSRRIAIYSALFGRDQRGNIECPAEGRFNKVSNTSSSEPGWNYTFSIEDCESECTLQTVMEQCHGRRRCTVEATVSNFGDPCQYGTPKYLKIVYTCVPKRILKEMKNNQGEPFPNSFCSTNRSRANNNRKEGPETETPSDGIPPDQRGDRLLTSTPGRHNKNGKSNGDNLPERSTYNYNGFSPATSKPELTGGQNESGGEGAPPETTDSAVTMDAGSAAAVEEDYVGFVTDWIYTYDFLKDNLEKLILYIILCVFLGLILLLVTIIIRMAQKRHRKQHTAKLNISEPGPNSSGQTEDLELLSDSDRTADGIEILSINHNNRPPPFRTDTGSRSMNSSYYG